VGAKWINDVLLVSKAYCTRVGEGPFFSEADSEHQELFRRLGHEFGATTGRPRRCGWLDLPALKYAARINGATALALTKIDILAGFSQIKVGMAYRQQGQGEVSFSDAHYAHLEGWPIEMVYRELKPLGAMPTKVSRIGDFPATLRELVQLVEDYVDLPVRLISYGKERGQELMLES
jgi:adenylosuccinate synthase